MGRTGTGRSNRRRASPFSTRTAPLRGTAAAVGLQRHRARLRCRRGCRRRGAAPSAGGGSPTEVHVEAFSCRAANTRHRSRDEATSLAARAPLASGTKIGKYIAATWHVLCVFCLLFLVCFVYFSLFMLSPFVCLSTLCVLSTYQRLFVSTPVICVVPHIM